MIDSDKKIQQNQNTPDNQAMPQRPYRRGGGPHAIVPGEKPKNTSQTTRRLLRTMRPYRLSISAAIVLALGSTAFSIIGPRFLGQATTFIFEGAVRRFTQAGQPGIDFSSIARILVWLLIVFVVSSVFNYFQGFIMAGISMKITYQFRKNIASKISRMPMQYFDRQTHGEILSRVTNDVDLVGNTLSQSLTQIISAVVTVLGVLVMMLTINWLMTAAVLLMVPLSTGLIAFVVKRSQKYFSRQQKILGQLNGHVEEMYSGHVVMKAFNGEAESIKTFSKLNTSLHETAWKSQFMSGMMHPIMNFIGNIGYVAICILGGWLVIKKTIAVGDIQAFIQYMRSFTQPLAQIAGTTNMLQSTLAAAERVFEFIDEPEEIPDSSESVQTDLLSGSVIFDHVQFGYLPGQTVIRDFSASIKPGQKVAIVGPTGAGKTTLVKLLMRFYDVDSGSIKLDQHDIRSFTRSDLRSQFGMVLQDTWLFNGTIRDNIRYGQLDASDEEIEQAARAAYVNHFIHTLPHGFDMVLNEDASNISQGQKQLLTIARAILSDPKILILDEATSSVDTRTEILIQQAMNELMKGKTSFIIAHRLSTIRNADLMLVLRDGDIVEQGTHDELLAADGFYADLYNSQFEQSSAAVNS